MRSLHISKPEMYHPDSATTDHWTTDSWARLHLINEAGARGERVVVATVAHTRGSTPQQRGAKMLFFENGKVAGTVGGGCIEAEVWAEARAAMRSGKSALHHFSLTAEEASEEGMVCGGTMDIFVDVWD